MQNLYMPGQARGNNAHADRHTRLALRLQPLT